MVVSLCMWIQSASAGKDTQVRTIQVLRVSEDGTSS